MSKRPWVARLASARDRVPVSIASAVTRRPSRGPTLKEAVTSSVADRAVTSRATASLVDLNHHAAPVILVPTRIASGDAQACA